MVSCWTYPSLLSGSLVDCSLKLLLACVVAAKIVYVSIPIIELSVLACESSISDMDVRVSTCSIYMVVESFAGTASSHLEIGTWTAESS